jgi:hypothetical protein
MEPLIALLSLKLFTWFRMFGELKGENSFNNESNSTPCKLDYNPLSRPIILNRRNALLADMAMVEGVVMGDFLYFFPYEIMCDLFA